MEGPDPNAPPDALELLSHETRVAILRALVEASREHPRDPTLAFTNLRDAAGIDDTGRFNYHLNQLLGEYVVREDGYRLSAFGRRVVGPMLAGAYGTDDASAPAPIPTEAACPACGDSLALRYADGTFDLACDANHVVLGGLSTYPSVVEGRSPAAARRLLGRLARQSIELAVEGVCPVCYAHAETTVTGDVVPYAGDHLFVGQCTTCGNRPALSVACCALPHPRVREFYLDRGVDLRQTPPWRVASLMPGGEDRVGDDPLRLRTTLSCDGDHLDVVVDGDGAVVAVEG